MWNSFASRKLLKVSIARDVASVHDTTVVAHKRVGRSGRIIPVDDEIVDGVGAEKWLRFR